MDFEIENESNTHVLVASNIMYPNAHSVVTPMPDDKFFTDC